MEKCALVMAYRLSYGYSDIIIYLLPLGCLNGLAITKIIKVPFDFYLNDRQTRTLQILSNFSSKAELKIEGIKMIIHFFYDLQLHL